MAIINVTPDSFSDGGRHNNVNAAIDHALQCLSDGADILDIGGESTRPGAAEVSAQEEQDRVLPVIEALRAEGSAVISIDTYRASTAKCAVEAGAHIVNDVHGLQREPEIANIAAEYGSGLCIMHTNRNRDAVIDVIDDQKVFFERSLEIARNAGVTDTSITLDPGFGFGKDLQHDVELMARFEEIVSLGYPLLVGTSRKRTLGALTGRQVAADRDIATATTSALLRMSGAMIFRVHNVSATRDALRVADAILQAKQNHLSGDFQ